jgi:hypothetical protein
VKRETIRVVRTGVRAGVAGPIVAESYRNDSL